MVSNFEQIMEVMSSLIKRIRNDKSQINFVQIGSHDCESFDDLPSSFVNINDYGHFIEPVSNVFKQLTINRVKYKNCDFHNFAIIPNSGFYSEHFHTHTKGCQSSFIKGVYYDDKPESDTWEVNKIETKTVEEFISINSPESPDVYFISTQGYDNDIVKEILNFHEPKIFFIESWDMTSINNVISSNLTETPKDIKFTTKDELFTLLDSKGYKYLHENQKDRLIAWKLNNLPINDEKIMMEKTIIEKTISDGKKYISFSLFGSDLKYYIGAEKNVLLNNQLLPDWETVIYYHPNNFRDEYLKKLKDRGAIMVDVSNVIIGGKSSEHFPFFWRFLSFLNDGMTLSRDLDSRLSNREVEYIRQWEKSREDYFIIRDHPWHSPYPSGLFGVSRKISEFETNFHDYISSNELVWGADQDILEKYMVDKKTEDILYFGYDKTETYIPRDDEDFFIGMQLDEFDNPTKPSGVKCLEFLSELNLPTNFKKNFKYFMTTLSINEPYFEKSLKFYTELHERTKNCYFNITTSQKDLERLTEHTGLTHEEFKVKYPKLSLTTVEDFNFRITFPLEMDGNGFIFNLNLKVLSIKACLQSKIKFDYLIFIDGDWGIYDGFSEDQLLKLFSIMNDNDIDFGFERPAKIGEGRVNPSQTFYADKFYDYNCLENPLWDNAHVVNEQFLVFKNNWKLTLFEQKWEQMLWYSIANNIRNYPDGFEIGISALESGMNWNYKLFSVLNNCFYFHAKYTNIKHTRF
jgi:hypothetical protein